MANFSPGWNFNPANWAEILLRIQDGLQPGMKLLAPAPNTKLRSKSLRRIKMAPRTRVVKIGALLSSQFGLLTELNFQLFWMVTAYKMMEIKWNLSLAAYLLARKTYLQRKKKYLQARRVHGFPDSVVLFNLVCSEVDVLILYLSFEIRETMNKILSFITLIPLKSLLLPQRQPYCFLLFSPGWNSVSITWDFFRFSGPFGRAENPSPVCKNPARIYDCQLFLKYRREIFILGVVGFLKTTRSFLNVLEVWSLPKMSEVFRRRPSVT